MENYLPSYYYYVDPFSKLETAYHGWARPTIWYRLECELDNNLSREHALEVYS